MSTKKITFKNEDGISLAARLELPESQSPHSYAIFAHCFTCSKNLMAVRNISRSLNNKGIAVLRFDFTGLGDSEGEFADATFSGNISDLKFAAKFLEENYEAPSLLIGHSLGGAAVIFAAAEIESIQAVATVGAPSSPQHVTHLFSEGLDEIREKGEAEVSIGGRPFRMKNQFIEDIEAKKMKEVVKNLRKPLLVIHSPQDTTVGIENAKEIYVAAHHPKSFVSIDKADHLLTRKEDAVYVGNVISGWAERYLEIPVREELKTSHEVAVSIGNEGFTSEVRAGKHLLIADEPEKVGGNDFGPSPYHFVSSGLGACTAMTLRMYADRKKWDLQKVIVHVDHGKEHVEDVAQDNTGDSTKIDVFERKIEIYGSLSEEQITRLMEIADKCPVHRTLESSSIIRTTRKEN